MISRRSLNEIAESYDQAYEVLNRVAADLEDTSVMISAAGEEFTRLSSDVIDRLNEVIARIGSVRTRLGQVNPDDGQ
ncbi:hypothetical protein ORV05_02070 [Amycolatopsis cynarae]|uniref:Uncharacterized protein n=1 Tax=Amycolatopsis cynarae TaxID=2995223 RepID=A0ABY7B2U3_9PSEU|nr:hypothetical protein [Amycolatopsis sp. HUAS 11-8]WAL66626.1 hypothetical protein ORV05_02070 [Amycolatopsis sp. HUAS 11-8]